MLIILFSKQWVVHLMKVALRVCQTKEISLLKFPFFHPPHCYWHILNFVAMISYFTTSDDICLIIQLKRMPINEMWLRWYRNAHIGRLFRKLVMWVSERNKVQIWWHVPLWRQCTNNSIDCLDQLSAEIFSDWCIDFSILSAHQS